MNLYQLTNDFVQLQDLIERGELDEETARDTMEALNLTLEKKVEGVVYVVKNQEALVPGIDAEIERLQAIKRRIQNATGHLKDNLKRWMDAADLRQVKIGHFTVAIHKNPPAVEQTAPLDHIPQEYVRTKIEQSIDRKKAVEDLKAGKEIVGLKLKEGSHVRIK